MEKKMSNSMNDATLLHRGAAWPHGSFCNCGLAIRENSSACDEPHECVRFEFRLASGRRATGLSYDLRMKLQRCLTALLLVACAAAPQAVQQNRYSPGVISDFAIYERRA